MDLIVFNCPKCDQELEVDSSGAGEEITCPACAQQIRIPAPTAANLKASASEAVGEQGNWGGPAVNAIASSAAAKVEMHLRVPVHDTPQDHLITKALAPLEVAAKESDRKLRIKCIRHVDCVEVGRDRFEEMVANFLAKAGEHNVVSINTVAYTHIDVASQKLLTDFGVLIVYKG